jgi:hypothetical protein
MSRAESGQFSFHSVDRIREMSHIEDKYCGYLLALTAYLGYDDIVHNTDRKRTPMTKSDVMRVLEISERTYQGFLSTMRKNEIISDVVADEINTYSINPIYVFRGKSYRNQRLIKSFNDEVRELYSDNKAKDLGFLYKLLPFVHYSTNYLAHNPDEENPLAVQTISCAELALLMGVEEKTLSNKMRRLKIGDIPVFACIRVSVYRMDGKPDDSVVIPFTNSIRQAMGHKHIN